MSRTREFDPEEALDRAVRLFWSRGFNETSMDDLVKRTGVSRYGFYGTFGSKRELFEKALKAYAREMATTLQKDLRRPEAGLPEIRAYFDTLLALGKTEMARQGCLICNTAVEVAPRDRRVAKLIRGLFEEVAGVFERALRNAVKAGDLKIPSREIPARARFLVGAIQGLAVLARTGTEMAGLREYVRTLLATLG